MRPRGLAVVAFLFLLAPSRAFAVKEWYVHYDEAKDAMREKRWQDALKSLQEAVRLKPEPDPRARPYGLEFVEYLPYFHQGICYLRLEDFNSATRLFNIEEDKGAIRKTESQKELRKLRGEAEASERQRVARLTKVEADRLFKEASDLHAARRYDDALARLAQAQVAAVSLDPQTQRQIADLRERIREAQRRETDAAERGRRVEQEVQDARRLLDEGKLAEAVVHFDQALAVDPTNRRAQDGKKEANDRILASQGKRALDAAFQQGKGLFDSGRYEEAVQPLTAAAADPANLGAREYLDKVRKILEGLRQAKDTALRIERLLGEGERLIAAAKFPEAQVRLENVLALDPTNLKARDRLSFAEMGTGKALFERFFPNRAPALTIVEPRASDVEVEAPSIAIVGVATDDRRVAKIEFMSGDRLLGEQALPPRSDSAEAATSARFERVFPLAPGLNLISVVATDSGGLKGRAELFRVTRKLRFYETRVFLPAAMLTACAFVALGFTAQHMKRRRAVRNRFNPYIAGAPVMSDELFFGRQKLMNRILNVLHHNSLMITGERRIGKTSFLYHLRKTLAADEGTDYRFFPVFTDLQGVTEAGFFHAVMSDVVESLEPDSAARATLRHRAGEEEGYDGRDFSHDLQRLVEELKTRTPKKVKLALLIDEVDVLNEFSERINQRLRSIFMKTFSENLVAVMSGVGIKRAWKSEGSPWYNFFDEIELKAFSREDAFDLIRTPVEGVFRYEDAAVEAILLASESKPYLIQKFCIYVVNRIIEEGRTTVTPRDVEAVKDAVHFESNAPEEKAPPRRQVSA